MTASHDKGFSAVELLVALFVAALFLAAGHRLYTSVIRENGQIRQRALASNIARDYMRKQANSAPSPCVAATPLNNATPSPQPDSLYNPRITVVRSCPGSGNGLNNLTKIEATLTYGAERRETVTHAVYTSS